MKMSSEDEKILSEMTSMFEDLDKEDAKSTKCPTCNSNVNPQDQYCGTCGLQLRKPERPKVIVRRITVT